jgi:hypothetical protein
VPEAGDKKIYAQYSIGSACVTKAGAYCNTSNPSKKKMEGGMVMG